jgi:hypothetical protein
MITKTEYEAAVAQKEAAEKTMAAYHKQKGERADQRYKEFREGDKPYTADELTWAAATRCPCGHGMAYVTECGSQRFWDCSAILTGVADQNITHGAQAPFAFYSIKSDDQPSANGASTRKPGPISPNVAFVDPIRGGQDMEGAMALAKQVLIIEREDDRKAKLEQILRESVNIYCRVLRAMIIIKDLARNKEEEE